MNTESIFKTRSIDDIYDEIRQVYLDDDRPWILGFSGGKDSTCMVQLIWNAISKIPETKIHKKIFIISSDTLVESPKVVEQITSTLDLMEKAAKKTHLPISTNLVRPVLEDTFWVCLLGKGFPAPSNLFRWCTERLKIRNADRFIQEKVSQYGEAIVVLGTRKDESGSRQQLMELYEIKKSKLSRHSKFAQTYVYTPLRDFITEDVWHYLLQYKKNPWGGNNRDLLTLYQNANNAECPLVVDTTTPSCGNSRFGCWVCTVVDKDSSLKNTIDNGEEWMEPLLELREELKATQDPEKRKDVRSLKRRNGHMKLIDDDKKKSFEENIRKSQMNTKTFDENKIDPYSVLVPGPYTLEFRMEFLGKLLNAQKTINEKESSKNIELISEDELHEIQRLWRMEHGDWKNSVYQIYEKIIGEKLTIPKDDLTKFGKLEQELLENICVKNNTSHILVSKLLHAEYESHGMALHSKVYDKINKILSEEWRDNVDDIIDDLEEQKNLKRDKK